MIIQTKFEHNSLKIIATGPKYPKKSENFKSGYTDIWIAQNIRSHDMIIHTKFEVNSFKIEATGA